METLCIRYRDFLATRTFTDGDRAHSQKLLDMFRSGSVVVDTSLIIDCHGYRRYDLVWLIEFVVLEGHCVVDRVEWIVGFGSHTQNRPVMDYAASLDWKSPLHQFLIDALVGWKQGPFISSARGKVILKIQHRKH